MKNLNKYLIISYIILFLSIPTAHSQPQPKPPAVKKIAKQNVLHGDTTYDNYHWMIENKYDVDLVNYLYAENAYAEKSMKGTELLRKKLYEEYLSYMQEVGQSEPLKRDSFYYYSRMEKDKEFMLYCRKKDSLSAKEEVYLNMNELAKKYMYVSLAGATITKDHKNLAYGLNSVGGDAAYYYFKNLETGEMYPEEIENVSQLAWADNKTFYYIKENSKTKRADALYRHTLGDLVKSDTLIYREKDASIYLSLYPSGEYLMLERSQFDVNEVLFMKRSEPYSLFKRFEPIQKGVKYQLEHYKKENYFYIQTNWNAPNGKFMRAPLQPTPKAKWEVVVPYNKDIILSDVAVKKDYFICSEREKGNEYIKIINRKSKYNYRVKINEEVYSLDYRTFDYDTTYIRYGYSSLLKPVKYFTHYLDSRTDSVYIDTLSKKQDINPDDYIIKRLWAYAPDSALVPMDIVYKKGLKINGKAPVYMYAYGCYGNILSSDFNISLKSIVDRGFIYVLAHPRGESFMGKSWHDKGKLLNKKNTYTDIIACAEHLIKEGYTSKGKIAIRGGSAGGMLVGSVVTMRPDLWGAAVAEVPFVDVLNQMQDTSWSNVIAHFQEIGNPFKAKEYFAIKEWCPYQNTKPMKYPPILVTAGYNDSRVPVWSPAKWTAKLRDVKQDTNLVLLKTNMDAGHGGSSGRYSFLKDEAFVMAFIMRNLGVKEDYIEVRGKIVDPDGSPVSFANVFVKNTTYGTVSNYEGEFLLELKANQLDTVVIKSVGFSTKELPIDLNTRTSDLEIVLENEDVYIQQVVVTSDGKDPAYGIIKKAQKKRKYYRDLVKSYSTDVYMKGSERLNEIPKKIPKFIKGSDFPDSTDLGLIYLSESVARYHYRQPNDYKEEMFASKQAGTKHGYSWNRAEDVMFNFYNNLVDMKWYSERGFVSPIASSANFYYKYKLLESFKDQGEIIYKIKVIPRRKSDPIFKGTIYITEGKWNIHSLNLMISKKSQIEFVDSINIKQSFIPINDSISMPLSMEITDHIKIFGFAATGKSLGFFSNYRVNREFTDDFFQNEVFKVAKNANKKDSVFWEETRPALLTLEEEENYRKGDSLLRLHNSKAYKDSVNKARNKVGIGKILFSGYTYTDNFKNHSWNINSLISMPDFNTVEGLTLNLEPSFRKDVDSLSMPWFTKYYVRGKLRYSLNTNKFHGEALGYYHFDFINDKTIRFAAGHRVTQYNPDAIDPLLNTAYSLLYEENYAKFYEETFTKFGYYMNAGTSFNLGASLKYSHRNALTNSTDFSFVNIDNKEYTSNNPLNPTDDSPAFKSNNAFVVAAKVKFYFKRTFQSYPDVRLYNMTNKPTLTLSLKTAIPLQEGDAQYNYADFNISDDIKLNNFGTSYYSATVGGFFGDKPADFIDYKHFNGNQTMFLRNNPGIDAFNTMDYYKYSTNDYFVSAHYSHHFNGWVVNKFPLIRRLKFQTLGGINFLHTSNNKNFAELYFGFENIFGFLRVDFVGQYSNDEEFKPQFRLGVDFGI